MESRALTRWAIASLVPLGMLIAAVVLKPYWRDEYWSLFFSDPRVPLPDLLAGRMREEVHPPLYYILLHYWRMILDTDLFARLLSIPLLLIGGFFAWLLYRGRDAFAPFLLICAGSYWMIYYAAETRPYTLLFVLCALGTLVAARALERDVKHARWAIAWMALGALASFTHYFGALWAASGGLCVGLVLLTRGKFGAFVAWGIASVIAIAPAAYWISVSLPVLRDAQGIAAHYVGNADQLSYAANQLLRGLFVKGFGSNPALWVVAFFGLGALWAKREAIDRALLVAIVLAIALAFATHMLFHPLIKERAFIVVIPALFLILARGVTAIREEQTKARWALRWLVPIFTVLMPLAFISEYFKDREQLGEVHAFLQEHGGDCANQPILAYLRGDRHPEFPAWVTRRQLAAVTPAGAAPPLMLDVEALTARGEIAPPADPRCRIRGVAFLMPRNEGETHEAARRAVRSASPPGMALEEHRFGGNRQIVFTTGDAP